MFRRAPAHTWASLGSLSLSLECRRYLHSDLIGRTVEMDVRWRHPFTCLISGPTGSGKTVWVTRFLSNLPLLMNPVPEEVIWCYGEWQLGYNQLKREGVIFTEGLPKVEEWSTNKRRLVILDDLMSETDDRVTKLFTKGSHHRNISVMYIVQNLFGKNKRAANHQSEQSLLGGV